MLLEWGVLVLIIILVYLAFRDDLEEIYLARNSFKCKRCGHCCGLKVTLKDEDKKRLRKHGYGKYINRMFLKRINGWCPFLKIEKGKATCTIYSIRPGLCQRWPKKKFLGIKAYDKRCRQFKRPWFLP